MKSTRDTDYIRIGIQYYVIGRFANLSFYSPNAGNLFHHGLEMLMKARLLEKYTPDQLYIKFGHNLPTLWEAFKEITNTKEVAKFDELIQETQRWEEIRYPAYPKGKSIVFTTMVGKRQEMDKKRKDSDTQRHYKVFLDEIDELFQHVILCWPMSPQFVKLLICQTIEPYDRALQMYEEMNNFKVWKKE